MQIPWMLLVQLAWRNVWRHARRNTSLMLAVALAVGTLLPANALVRGMLSDLEAQAIEQLTGHLKVQSRAYRDDPSIDYSFRPPPALGTTLSDPRVLGATERLGVPAVIQSERETRGVDLYGVDPAAELQLSFIGDAQIEGRWLDGMGDGGVVLGADLVRQLETAVDRRVVLMSERADGGRAEWGARIVGVYSTSSPGAEKFIAFTGRRALQARLESPGVTEVSVMLRDPTDIAAVEARLEPVVAPLDVSDWTALKPLIAALVSMSGAMIGIFVGVFMVALAFGVLNTLIAVVLERTRELGLLQALGMKRSWIVLQVMIESGVIIAVGLVAGLLLGRWVIWLLRDGVDLSAFAEGMAMLGGSTVITPVITGADVALVVATVLTLGFVGALYPAWRAVRIEPLEALGKH